MLTGPHAAIVIDLALERLGVPEPERGPLFCDIVSAALPTMFRRPRAGNRISSTQIVGALKGIEDGLRQISVAVNVIDDAIATAGADDSDRKETLSIVQRGALGAIAGAILRRIYPQATCDAQDEQIAAAMPTHGPGRSFENSWNHTFADAATRVATIRAGYSELDFRAQTRSREEWLANVLSELLNIFERATGRAARLYRKGGETAGEDWVPPAHRFICDLWPLLAADAEEAANPPSITRIKNHVRLASELSRARSME